MTPIATPHDAEVNAAAQMRAMGFTDAAVTVAGADGGIDVRSHRAVAQVKLHSKPTGRPDLQRLFGARGADTSKGLLFFTLAGYSAAAIEYANQVDMALFTYSLDGGVRAINRPAVALLTREAERQQVEEARRAAVAAAEAARKEQQAADEAAATARKRELFEQRTGYRKDSYREVIGNRFVLVFCGFLAYGSLIVGVGGMIVGSGIGERVLALGLCVFSVVMFGVKWSARNELQQYRVDPNQPRFDQQNGLLAGSVGCAILGLLLLIGGLGGALGGPQLDDRLLGLALCALAAHLLYVAWSAFRKLRSLAVSAKGRSSSRQ